MKYREPDLEQALVDIANRKGTWAVRAPDVCRRAMHRITELENAWDAIRDKAKDLHELADFPDDPNRSS